MGEIVPYFALAVCLFFAIFALYQIEQPKSSLTAHNNKA